MTSRTREYKYFFLYIWFLQAINSEVASTKAKNMSFQFHTPQKKSKGLTWYIESDFVTTFRSNFRTT